MPEHKRGTREPTISCPFCGLGCDDLSPTRSNGRQRVDARGCAIAEGRFARALDAEPTAPRIAGKPASLDAALDAVAGYLSHAKLPLFAGLRGDLLDIRGMLQLAGHTGGVIDHANGDALMANLAVLEGSGWITTSLGEARNRADLMLLVGDGLMEAFPRLGERLLFPTQRLHRDRPAEIVLLGSEPRPPQGMVAETIRIDSALIGEFIGAVRARLAGRSLFESPFPEADALSQRLSRASYPVVAFSAGALGSAHPDLCVRTLAALVRDLNAEGRAALLPLGGADGETSAMQAGAWHTGFGPRVAFNTGVPVYQPRAGATRRLLQQGEADLLVWLSTLNDDPPPAASAATLVLGHPGTRLEREPEVFIPLAVPGVHRAGAVHRGDGLALLPLRPLTKASPPDGPEVLTRLLGLLSRENATC